MVTWLRIVLVALALVAGLADRAGVNDTTVEVLERIVDDAVIETDAPALPRFVTTLEFTEADSTLPHAPPMAPIFRPPRLAS